MRVVSVRVEMNREGARALLNDPAVENYLLNIALDIAAAASAEGGDFVADSSRGGARARAVVITADAQAMAGEASDRRLTRALGAGRR